MTARTAAEHEPPLGERSRRSPDHARILIEKGAKGRHFGKPLCGEHRATTSLAVARTSAPTPPQDQGGAPPCSALPLSLDRRLGPLRQRRPRIRGAPLRGSALPLSLDRRLGPLRQRRPKIRGAPLRGSAAPSPRCLWIGVSGLCANAAPGSGGRPSAAPPPAVSGSASRASAPTPPQDQGGAPPLLRPPLSLDRRPGPSRRRSPWIARAADLRVDALSGSEHPARPSAGAAPAQPPRTHLVPRAAPRGLSTCTDRSL